MSKRIGVLSALEQDLKAIGQGTYRPPPAPPVGTRPMPAIAARTELLPRPLQQPRDVAWAHPVPPAGVSRARPLPPLQCTKRDLPPPTPTEDMGEFDAVVVEVIVGNGKVFLESPALGDLIFSQLKKLKSLLGRPVLSGDKIRCRVGKQEDGRLRLTAVVSASRGGVPLQLPRRG